MPKINLQRGERLIDAIRAARTLYDPKHADYNDTATKAAMWKVVAAKTNMTTSEAKTTWKNLRDSYRIYRGKATRNPNARKWKFYESMDFLAPYIKGRNSNSTKADSDEVPAPAPAQHQESRTFDESLLDINENEGDFTTVQYWNDLDGTHEKQEVKPEADVEDDNPQFVAQQSDVEIIIDSSDSEHESFEDVLPEVLKKGDDEDKGLKMFFDAMYASTCQMPQNMQRIVKQKIFSAVMEGEESYEKSKSVRTRRSRLKVES